MRLPTGTQMNIGGLGQSDFLAINLAKTSDIWHVNAGTPTEDFRTLCTDDDYLTKMPAGVTNISREFFVYDLTSAGPEGAHNLVLSWSGVGTVDLQGYAYDSTSTTLSFLSSTSNTKTYSMTTYSSVHTYGYVSIVFTAINTSTPISNVTVMRDDHVALYATGKKVNPTAVNFYKVPQVLRTMDATGTNENMKVLWAHRRTEFNFSDQSRTYPTKIFAGSAPQPSENQYVCAGTVNGSPTVWTHGQMVMFVPVANFTDHAIQAVTKANPAAVQCNAHGLTTGMTFEFAPGQPSMMQLESQTSVVTVVDANNFTCNTINSTSYSTYTVGASGRRQISLATSTLPAKPLRRVSGNPLTIATEIFANQPRVAVYDSVLNCLLMCGVNGQLTNAYNPAYSYEFLIDLCNECGSDLWINIPHMADDTFVTNLATLCRDRLLPARAVYMEYSNEIWNIANAFNQTTWAGNRAIQRWGNTGPNVDEWLGKRFQECAEIFTNVFAGQMTRLNRVLACWATQASQAAQRLPSTLHFTDTGKRAYLWADFVASACYYTHLNELWDATMQLQCWNYLQGGALQTKALQYLRDQMNITSIDTNEVGIMDQWKNVCDTYTNRDGLKLRLCHYEGGHSNYYTGSGFTVNARAITLAEITSFIFAGYALWGGEWYARNDRSLRKISSTGKQGGVLSSQYIGINGASAAGPWSTNDSLFHTLSQPTLDTIKLLNTGYTIWRANTV